MVAASPIGYCGFAVEQTLAALIFSLEKRHHLLCIRVSQSYHGPQMIHRLSSILALCLVAALNPAAQQAVAQTPTATGTWANDHGSVLVIGSVGPDGSVTGTYSNNAKGFKCAGVAFPLVGWMDGPRISYTVRWRNASVDCAQITSWTGYFNGARLGVEWVLTYDDNGTSKVAAGSDSYTRR